MSKKGRAASSGNGLSEGSKPSSDAIDGSKSSSSSSGKQSNPSVVACPGLFSSGADSIYGKKKVLSIISFVLGHDTQEGRGHIILL